MGLVAMLIGLQNWGQKLAVKDIRLVIFFKASVTNSKPSFWESKIQY